MKRPAQLQTRRKTQPRGMSKLLLDVPSKNRPTWDEEMIRARMVAARKRLNLDVKEAADKAGMSQWSWYKKEPTGGIAFQPEECIRFAERTGAPTLFPFYDWDHAADIDARLGWDK